MYLTMNDLGLSGSIGVASMSSLALSIKRDLDALEADASREAAGEGGWTSWVSETASQWGWGGGPGGSLLDKQRAVQQRLIEARSRLSASEYSTLRQQYDRITSTTQVVTGRESTRAREITEDLRKSQEGTCNDLMYLATHPIDCWWEGLSFGTKALVVGVPVLMVTGATFFYFGPLIKASSSAIAKRIS